MKTLEMMIQTLCQAGRCPEETIRSSVKETGKPAVGCFPLFVPEELVYAAGFLPRSLKRQAHLPAQDVHAVGCYADLAHRVVLRPQEIPCRLCGLQ